MYVSIMHITLVSIMYLLCTASLTNTELSARKVILFAFAKASASCLAPTSDKLLTSPRCLRKCRPLCMSSIPVDWEAQGRVGVFDPICGHLDKRLVCNVARVMPMLGDVLPIILIPVGTAASWPRSQCPVHMPCFTTVL